MDEKKSQRNGATLWLPSRQVRDKLRNKCHKGETFYEMLRRKGVFK